MDSDVFEGQNIMHKRIFRHRKCKVCGKGFQPLYANQRYHERCHRLKRMKDLCAYQRRFRKKMKSGWEDAE